MQFIKPLRVLLAIFSAMAFTVSVSAGPSAAVPLAAPTASTTYGSGDTSFTLALPSGWRPKSDEDGFAQFSGPAKSFLWVQRSRIRKTELGPDELPLYYSSKGYKLLYERKATSLSGLAAGRFILLKTDAGVEWRYDVTDAFIDGMQWVVFAVAPREGFDKLSGSFLSIYSSMKLAGSQIAPKAKPTPAQATKTPAAKTPAVPTAQGKPAAPDTVAKPGAIAEGHPAMPPEQPSPAVSLPVGPELSAGKIAYEKAGEVWWSSGSQGQGPTSVGEGSAPRLSANGEFLVFKGKDGKWVVVHLTDGKPTRVPLDAKAGHVVISPDGTQIAYSVSRKYLFGAPSSTVYVVDLSGKLLKELRDVSIDQQPTAGGGGVALQADSCSNPEFGVAPDSLIVDARIAGGWSSVEVNMGTLKGKVLEAGGQGAMFSPDGRKIAYSRSFAGVNELWLSSADGRLHEKLLTSVGAYAWGPDSSTILVERQGGLESLSVTSGVASPFIGGASHPASSGH